ncbi:hypothetical protein [Sulfolobus ellipsoid virus 1]|uniref:SWIM-type domain-containing protein n=1 Tax=Sulfolobus ellipsoid virus 1 TaxID=2056194 RepID=A0A2H4RBM8_9VIRU|nr:hypothetical protein FGG62_gp11 [Sulfolobus ellipsoid virus 1]ATY46489.1 hypothetical protein [Sulfolobus ellipsoid virus 1]
MYKVLYRDPYFSLYEIDGHTVQVIKKDNAIIRTTCDCFAFIFDKECKHRKIAIILEKNLNKD